MDGNLFLLLICSIALTSVVGYACWIQIRVLRLKTDLAEILLDVRKTASSEGWQDDPAYLKFNIYMIETIRKAEMWSVPLLAYVAIKSSAHKGAFQKVMGSLDSKDSNVTTFLQSAMEDVTSRLMRSVLRETFSGWLILMMLWASARLSRDEIKQGTSALIGPLEAIQFA